MSIETAYAVDAADKGCSARFSLANQEDHGGPLGQLSSSFALVDDNGSLCQQAEWCIEVGFWVGSEVHSKQFAVHSSITQDSRFRSEVLKCSEDSEAVKLSTRVQCPVSRGPSSKHLTTPHRQFSELF